MYKVVVVEDEEFVRRGIVLMVDWHDLDCMVVGEAANGKQGYEITQKHEPDIVITDIKMPIMDGIEMVKTLKAANCKAQFIILTAYSDFCYAHQALKEGVADYLLKPFADGELEDAVCKIIQKLEEKHAPDTVQQAAFRFNIAKGEKSKYVEEAIRYIQNNYHLPELLASDVADGLGLSSGYLSRVFKKETDYTMGNYITNYRIHVAMNLLKDISVKVYEVADKVGYTDTAYFSTLFKKLTGISPSEYRDRCS